MNVIRKNCGGTDGVRRFITAVESRPQIWDPGHANATGNRLGWKKRIFEEILNELNWSDKVSVESAHQAWKYLKAQYAIEKANFAKNNSSFSWEFLDALQFIDKASSASAIRCSSIEERSELSRRSARYACAVPTCSSTEKSTVNQRPVLFFDMPDGKDRRLRQKWQQAIPELESAVSPAHQKVCEFHFVNGRPTDDSPVPTLLLGDEMSTEIKPSRKRKLSPPAETKSKTPSCDSSLQAVADSPVEKQKRQLSEAGNVESVKTYGNGSVGAKSPACQAKLVKLPLKALKTLSGAKLGTNFTIIRAPNGLAGIGTSQKVIINAKGERTRVVQLVKPSTLTSPGPKETVRVSSSVQKTRTLEDALTSLAANAPSVSEVNGSATTDKVKDEEEKKIEEESPSVSCDTAAAGISKMNVNAATSSTLDSSQSTDKESKPLTLLSALEQSLGPIASSLTSGACNSSTGLNSFPTLTPSLGNPAHIGHEITCSKCANELPVLRRGLGRLETRVDSMITMVKTLCARQAGIEAAKKAHPPVVIRPRISSATASSSSFKNVTSRNGITAIGNVPAESAGNVKKSTATIVRLGAPGSKFSLISSPRLLTSAQVSKPTNKAVATSLSQTAGRSSEGYAASQTAVVRRNPPTADRSSRDSSPDTLPPSLSTKFMPAPKQPDASISYLHKTIIRSLLLFSGSDFTIADFREKGPAIVRDVGPEKLRESLEKLLDSGLLRRLNDCSDLADEEAAYEKERQNCKLSTLVDYGITREQYESRLK